MDSFNFQDNDEDDIFFSGALKEYSYLFDAQPPPSVPNE